MELSRKYSPVPDTSPGQIGLRSVIRPNFSGESQRIVPSEVTCQIVGVQPGLPPWINPEWNRKAAAFVSYGSAMGARGVQQLRETAIELHIAPIRTSVHIPVATLWAHFQGGDVEKGLAELQKQGNVVIDDLLWWRH